MDRRLIRIVNVRRLPLEVAPESDDNLVNAKVRFPCRSKQNRKKGESTKDPKTAHPRRLMADPNLRCQVTNTMVAALPPIHDGTCISSIATDMADAMLSTATDLAPRSKRPHGAQGWFAGPGMEAEMNTARC